MCNSKNTNAGYAQLKEHLNRCHKQSDNVRLELIIGEIKKEKLKRNRK